MPLFSVVSTTVAQGGETAEVDISSGEFRSLDEGIGYARRIAEELFGLADQLALDFEYSQVALYEGDVDPPELDIDEPSFLGMWMLVDDGAAWADAQALRDDAAEDAAEAEAKH